MGYLDYAGLQYLWGKLKKKFAPKSHAHDDRYYTESEMDGKLNSKSNTNHTHDASTLINALGAGTAAPTDPDYVITQWVGGGTSNTTWVRRPMSSIWNYIKGKADGVYQPKGSYAASRHTHDDRYYTETEINTKLNGKANSLHTHTKAQITDFPSSLKNPTALTIQTNGTTAATYDGSAAKSVNITKTNIGLGNVDNTADKNKSVASAAKLTTTRTVSGGSDITLSFNYDGSSNSTANIGFYSCRHSVGSTNNYSFHRFAKLDANKGAWVDNSMTFLISQDYSGGGYGICRLVYRSNADSGSASVVAEWLVRKGLSADTVQVAIKTDKTNGAYCDAFYKSSGTYMGVVIRAIASGGRATLGRTWTLINSYEDNGTTATDKKTSSECWKTIADAGNALHKQAYSASASATDGGHVASAGSASNANVATIAAKLARNGTTSLPMTFNWSGQSGQPSWLWGGNDGTNMYVYNPSNFNVNYAKSAGSVAWGNVSGKPSTFTPSSHTHNYAGSGSAGGSANSAVKLDSSAGSNTQPVYFSGGKPVVIGYTIAKSVPADAKFTDTNTWRGIQNNLTSDSTDQSLSAAQGKVLKTLVDGKAPSSHKHTKSQITDFPTSMPASDVSAWAKAATKPSYTKSEVGLSNVDNTADKDKSVKFATSAASATNAQCLNNDSQYMKFHWSGKNGQPTWLWGGNDASNMYVYNPSNFNVNYATTAGIALTAKNLPYSITYEGSYVGTASRDSLSSSSASDKKYATETNPVKTTLSKEYDIVVFLDAGKSNASSINEICKSAFLWFTSNNSKFTESYVVMNALTNKWTRGVSTNGDNYSSGPIIEYNVSPKASIKYRKNGTSIERYWTREKLISASPYVGAPGSETYLSNGAYMLLDRHGITYHVFGIDIDHRIFASYNADEEGSELV